MYRIVEVMFSELKPLTALDPSLLYGFVCICPRKELPRLFSHLLPFLSMVFSAKLLKDSKVYTRDDVSCFYVTMDNWVSLLMVLYRFKKLSSV